MSDNPSNNESNFLPHLPGYNPAPANGYSVNESPVPGVTLRRILRGHEDSIDRSAWSPDGFFLASPSRDNTIRIWDILSGECIKVLTGHKERVLPGHMVSRWAKVSFGFSG